MEEKDKKKPPTKEEEQVKVEGNFPSKEHQFKPGCSGNPNGRTPGWRAELNKAAKEHYTPDKIIKMLEAMYNCGLKGDTTAQKEWLNRGLGKVTDRIDVTTDGEKLGITFIPAGAKKLDGEDN